MVLVAYHPHYHFQQRRMTMKMSPNELSDGAKNMGKQLKVARSDRNHIGNKAD